MTQPELKKHLMNIQREDDTILDVLYYSVTHNKKTESKIVVVYASLPKKIFSPRISSVDFNKIEDAVAYFMRPELSMGVTLSENNTQQAQIEMN